MSETGTNDDATDQRLRLLVGLVVVLGAGVALSWAIYTYRNPEPHPPVFALALLCASVIAANRLRVYVRIKSSLNGTAWGEVPVLVGLILLPAPWVLLCAVAGQAVLKIWSRSGPRKTAFAVAKESLTVSSAAVVLTLFGIRPHLTDPELPVLAVTVAMLAFILVDDLVFVPIMAADSRISLRQAVWHNWTRNIIGHIGQFFAILGVLWVLATHANVLLLLVVPLVVACMHLWQSRTTRTRQERESWQRLAKATDELNAVDLDQVLHSATTRAAQIFSYTHVYKRQQPAGAGSVPAR